MGLPPNQASAYNETVAKVERLSESQLSQARTQFLALKEFSSRLSTAAPVMVRSVPGTATAAGGGTCQEKPPPTPCPPRMAVPNSSPPATSSALVQAVAGAIGSLSSKAPSTREHEESDEEEDDYDTGIEAAS